MDYIERMNAIEAFKKDVYPQLGVKFYDVLRQKEEIFDTFAKRLGADGDSVSNRQDDKIEITLSTEEDNGYSTSTYTYSVVVDCVTGELKTSHMSEHYIFSKWQEFIYDCYTELLTEGKITPDGQPVEAAANLLAKAISRPAAASAPATTSPASAESSVSTSPSAAPASEHATSQPSAAPNASTKQDTTSIKTSDTKSSQRTTNPIYSDTKQSNPKP